jgi:regulator of sirC expression with transglutaminase-like and TPR domain
MMPAMTPRERFAELAALPDEAIDVALGAFLIAAEGRPEVDVSAGIAALDALAREARPRLAGAEALAARIDRMNFFLFVEQRFRGNHERYDDPENSFLDRVLARRTGIPITLGVVYVEVGRRLGLPLAGVGFPGHFLVRTTGPEEIVVDPFFGQVLTHADCDDRLRAQFGPNARFDPHLLRPATPREILARMLANLKQIFLHGGAWAPALAAIERILLLHPDAPAELRDRGLVWQRLECFGPALRDLERFLALAPDDPTAAAVREALPPLRERAARVQ